MKFWKDENGTIGIEYAASIAIIAFVVVLKAGDIGDWFTDTMSSVSDELSASTQTSEEVK